MMPVEGVGKIFEIQIVAQSIEQTAGTDSVA